MDLLVASMSTVVITAIGFVMMFLITGILNLIKTGGQTNE